MRALVAAAVVPPLLELGSFERIERGLGRLASLTPGRAPLPDADIARFVDQLLVRLPRPWRRTCLRRASVLYYLLRSAGRQVQLCIGVRRTDAGELLAHAWLLQDGQPYLEGASAPQTAAYRVIALFPAERRLAESA